MKQLLYDEDPLNAWVDAAEGIEERFGIDKALGYLIGEKFYNIVETQFRQVETTRGLCPTLRTAQSSQKFPTRAME